MTVGIGLTVLRHGTVLGTTALQRRLLVSVEISNRDKAYEWFLSWMAHQMAHRNPRWLPSHQLSVETLVQQRKNDSTSALFKLVAGPGTHYFKYRGAWMQVKRDRETRSINLASGAPWETVTLTALSKDRKLFPSLLSEARDLAVREQEGKLIINVPWGTDWKPFGLPRRRRPLQSVVLAPGFLNRRQWYVDRGIPYRRGYLLHGPPGSGKTSFIQALAGSLSYDISLLNLSERGLADDKLNYLLSNTPSNNFVLIEDVDAAFNKRVQTSEDGYQSSITFSGFLNALDGVASGEERIVFMTTNHLEKLDPALIRPGRVDLAELIDDASPVQAQILFSRFYSGAGDMNEEEVESLGVALHDLLQGGIKRNKRISMAALQGLFIRNGPTEALSSCRELVR
ncbi:BCS1 N terminal-domain-containing protein [Mycena floridula]|nr:BCS1 N terminal-domain-containing protein [Mycena floridula]